MYVSDDFEVNGHAYFDLFRWSSMIGSIYPSE